jgi:hypothetical protein
MAEALRSCIAGITETGSLSSEFTVTRVQRKLPRSAIRSVALGGKRKTKWKGITPATSIRIDYDSLDALRDRLSWELHQIQEDGASGSLGWQIVHERSQKVESALRQLDMIVDDSRNSVCPGAVPIRYAEGSTGRLFAEGTSLQTVPKDVRSAALAGCWDYDISNCHWTLIDQLAAKRGYECRAIRHYLSNKVEVRAGIAQSVGIDIEEVKECLLMLMYGAGKSVRDWGRDAIPTCIGVEAARRLYRNPSFIALDADVRAARQKILQDYPAQVGRISNVLGLQVSCKEEPPVLLAHILQGLEAKALMAVVQAYGDNIQLCVHDGWVTRQRLDIEEVQRLVSDAIGATVVVEEVLLQPVLHLTKPVPRPPSVDKIASIENSFVGQGVVADSLPSCASNADPGRADSPRQNADLASGLVLTQRPQWNWPRNKPGGKAD